MPRTPEERDLALKCLDLAVDYVGASISLGGPDPVEAAGRFYAFVTGTDAVDAAIDTPIVIARHCERKVFRA